MKADLDLSVPFGDITGYVNLKGSGKLGRLQRLWERYCGLRLRVAKLQMQLSEIEQKLLQEEPSFFNTRRSLVGPASFPFRPKLEEVHGPEVALRNAIILQATSLTARQTCQRLDSYDIQIPERWSTAFPALKTWQDAYKHRRCRPRVAKLISEVRSRRLLR